jgi:geranyl-CoA carboxylase alpha subunit
MITHGEERPSSRIELLSYQDGSLRYACNGVQKRLPALCRQEGIYLACEAASFLFSEASPYPGASNGLDPAKLRAPVAGIVTRIAAQAGDTVQAGQALICVEAMKMEMWLTAASAGTVKTISVASGEQVKAKALLMELELE